MILLRWPAALLLGTVLLLPACNHSPGSVSCGLDALTGPLTVKESFGRGNVLTAVPEVVPASLPVRMVAGPAWRSSVTVDGIHWRVHTLGHVAKQLRPGYGVLVVDEGNAPLGVLVFEGRLIPGAYDLGTIAVGDTTVPLLGVRINPNAIGNPACPVFPDSLR